MPAADVPKVKGDDRKAAEWILANWSDHRVFVDGKHVKSGAELPKGRLTVTSFSIDGRFYTGAAPLNQAVLMEHLGGLAGVRTMTMGGFQELKDENFAFIATLASLEELKLSRLACTDAFLAWIKDLRKLQKLDFSELPDFTGAGLDLLSSLPIQEAKFWKTKMNDAGVEALTGLKALKILGMEANRYITDASLAHLSKFPALERLYISATSITPDGLAAVTFPKLDSVGCNVLRGYTLRQIAPKAAVAFPNVTGFQISNDVQTSEDIAALAHFKKLARLANYGVIADGAWPGLLELRELESFDQKLAQAVPAAGLEAFAKLKKLKVLRLGTVKPDEAALAAFKKQRPDVRIEP